MIINKLTIQNFKSFGNEVQELILENKGNLILLSGRNGSGKSSIIDGFDYALYNKVKGRKSKKVKLYSLVNRINSGLEVNIEFTSHDGTEIIIKRGHNPSKLQLWENGVENLRAGKVKIDALIEGYIGIDHETFKGFISMSINDFKNFISLSNDEKKLLLDKLFNLEVITILNKILNDLIRENKREFDVLDREIEIINDNLESINESIEKVKKSKQEGIVEEMQSIKNQIESNRDPFIDVKDKLKLIKEKQIDIEERLTEEKTQLITINAEIKQIDKSLELFDNDKCPTCETDLNSEFHNGLKESFIEKKLKFEEVKEGIKSRGIKLKERENKLNKLNETGTEKYNDLNYNLKLLKKDYDRLKSKHEEEDHSDLDEFYTSMDKLNHKLQHAEVNKSYSSDKTVYHKYLKSVLSESGVKKTIIQNIIDPINHYVQENIQKMHLPFEVVLDDTFTADITSFGEEIDIDTLSTGETKAINVCILIAYLKLIRTKRQINVLFLDEVFSSIDVEKINDVIRLLRDLADHSKINIFLVHHSLLESEHFDKIYQVKKDVFSYIEKLDDVNSENL